MKPKEILADIIKKREEYQKTSDSDVLLKMEKEYAELFDMISTYFYLTNNPYQDYFSKLEKKPNYTLKEGSLIQISETGSSVFYYHPFILCDLALEDLLFLLLFQMEYVNSSLPLLQGKEQYRKVERLKDGILKQLYEENREWNKQLLENDEDGYFEKAFKEVPDLAKSEGNLTSRAFYQALRMEKRDIAMDEKAASYFSLDSLKDIAENDQKNVMLLFMEKLKSSTSGKEKGDKEGKNTSEVRIKKEKKIYWEKILRNVVGGVPYGKRHTHMRLNRRQPLRSDLSGTLSDRKASLVCAIDTSYSMDKEQVSKALSQILKLKMSLGFDMTLIQCDSKIQEVRKIKTKNDIPDIVKGRGGTAFTPVIEYLNDHKEYRNSVLIYFTDGYGERSIPKPYVRKVLWIIVDERLHISLSEPYGMVLPVSPEMKGEISK